MYLFEVGSCLIEESQSCFPFYFIHHILELFVIGCVCLCSNSTGTIAHHHYSGCISNIEGNNTSIGLTMPSNAGLLLLRTNRYIRKGI